MAIKYGKKRSKQHNVLYTVITAILLRTVSLIMVVNLYATTKEDAYENLHVQTKQIKDDIVLQLISDRENLTTMAAKMQYATQGKKHGRKGDPCLMIKDRQHALRSAVGLLWILP